MTTERRSAQKANAGNELPDEAYVAALASVPNIGPKTLRGL